jgi:hexosaminidase
MNYFQLHLTDDQGWRIEIKKYPGLNKTGSWRNGTMKGLWPGTGNDSIRHGGYYTQQELKELVKYANEQYITLIPEIEMPGHALAALASYEYLGCTGGPYKVKETWGAAEDVFCAGKESTFEFLQDVLDEVLEIFPSEYIHIGGDECEKTRWEKCTACQLRIKSEGIKNEAELQNYFITRIAKYLKSKGRTIIGWDEILEGGTPPGAVIMSWRGNGEKGCIDAVRAGHAVILSPGYGFYLDYPQTSHEDSLAADWGGVTPVRKTYMYELFNDSIKREETDLILGGQTNIWTEYINNASKVEYMAFPRLSAVSEVLWSPRAKRDWDSFKTRIRRHYDFYRMWGIKFNPADPDEE